MPDNEEPQDLRSVLSQVVSDSEAEAPAGPSRRPELPPRDDNAPAAQADDGRSESGDDRPRGPDGKFVPKDGAARANGADDSGDLEPVDDAPAAPVAEPPVDVPQHWSAADKDLIAGLPKEHQSAVVARYKAIEAGFTPRLQRAAEIERQYQGAIELFQPYAEVLRQRGQTPSDIIRGYVSIEADLARGAQQAAQGGVNDLGARHVANMIATYSIDPGRVAAYLRGEQPDGNMAAGGTGGYQAPAPVNPQLLQEINTLRTEVRGISGQFQGRLENESKAQIDAFINEKDANGALKHPYFTELEGDMMRFAQIEISQGKMPRIADLYETAVYANRATRDKLLAANSAEAQRKTAADRRAKADAATRAASSVTGTPGSGGSPAERRGNRSLREELEEAAAESS